jgi:uncharacterized protein (DUF488 family)
MSDSAPDIFTIGYEGLVQDQLLDLVQAAGVQVLLDVRAIAASRKAGFSKTLLRGSLEGRGVGYVHDVRLGTPKAGRQAARAGRVSEMAAIFDAHMRTEAAQAGLEAAVALAAGRRVCLLCFERDAHDCHRGILAGMIRGRTGQAIRHL